MIARTTPYALTPHEAALDSLVTRVSAGGPGAGELKLAANDARELFERMVAGDAPDRAPGDAWLARYDGAKLFVSGPRGTALATFDDGSLAWVAIDFPGGTFDLSREPDGSRVQLTDAGGAMLAHYIFGDDGSVVDVLAPPPVEEVTSVAPPPPPPLPEKQWYYVAEGKTEGPLPESELRAKLISMPRSTLVWNAELPAWKSAEEAGVAPAATPVAAPPVPAVPPPPFAAEPAPVAAPQPAPAVRKWELAQKSGEGTGGPWRLSGEVRIGRIPECEICLADGLASRVHAVVREEADGFFLSDNKSTNGTELNGFPVTAPVRLAPGDVIRVGDTELVVKAEEAGAGDFSKPVVAAPAPQVASGSLWDEHRAAPMFEQRPAAVSADPLADLFGPPQPTASPGPAAPVFEQPRAAEPAGGLRFCTGCGGRNLADANFCVHCGQRL